MGAAHVGSRRARASAHAANATTAAANAGAMNITRHGPTLTVPRSTAVRVGNPTRSGFVLVDVSV